MYSQNYCLSGYLKAAFLSLFLGFFNFVGDGLRDAFDPKDEKIVRKMKLGKKDEIEKN
jgi:hypothetical protein